MFDVILFDLGRVVVGLGESPIPKCWLKYENAMSFEALANSEIRREFEKGHLTSREFITQLKEQLALEQTIDEVMEAFTSWPIGMYPKVEPILLQLREKYHLAVLSNTNDLHFPRLIDEFGIAEYFDTLFLSHHMGKAKPDLDAFKHVLDILEVRAEKVLFLDDNLQNVQAAEKLGIKSRQVCGENQVIQALKDENLL